MSEEITQQIVIPMAGLGLRFTSFGFKKNKYLLPIDQNLTTMIEKSITSLNAPKGTKFIFIIRTDIEEVIQILNEVCSKHNYQFVIKIIDKLTEGPASTVYEAKDLIDPRLPLFISNSDQILDINSNDFYNACKNCNCAGLVLTYNPGYPLIIGSSDKHSFLKFDDRGYIIDVDEKIVLSETALVGLHYYSSGNLFIKSYEHIFKNNIRAPNGEFYVSLTYKALVKLGLTIKHYHLNENEHFYPVGEPNDYFKYLQLTSPITIYPPIQTSNTSLKIYPGVSLEIFPNSYFTYQFKNKIMIILEGSLLFNSQNIGKNSICECENIVTTIISPTKLILIDYKCPINYIHNRNSFIRGWFIGNFKPSIDQNEDIEYGLLHHKQNEKWDFHYHSQAIETNYLIKGSMKVNDQIINEGSIFIFDKNQISCPEFITDCEIFCIKTPSITNDKFVI